MKKINHFLFVYGTLLDLKNEFGFFLNNNCSFFCAGKFRGRLYDIGKYPGAVAIDEEESWVHGSVFRMDDPESILKNLDVYEGFGEGQPQPNLFVRELVEIQTAIKTMQCWVYLYNLPLTGLRQIRSGKYFY